MEHCPGLRRPAAPALPCVPACGEGAPAPGFTLLSCACDSHSVATHRAVAKVAASPQIGAGCTALRLSADIVGGAWHPVQGNRAPTLRPPLQTTERVCSDTRKRILGNLAGVGRGQKKTPGTERGPTAAYVHVARTTLQAAVQPAPARPQGQERRQHSGQRISTGGAVWWHFKGWGWAWWLRP